MLKRGFYLTLTWLVLLLLPVPLIIIMNSGLIDSSEHLLAYDLGIVAYVWWLAIVLLSTRPRWLTRRLGMPALYAIHGALGILALVAATAHRFTSFSMFPLIKETGNIAWYLEIFLIVYAVLFLSGWLVDRLKKVKQFKRWVEQHLLNHQSTIWIHRLNLVVIALIWLHVMVIPRLGMISNFRLVFNIYTIVTLIIYCWWKLMLNWPTPVATVAQNVAINDEIQKITLKLGHNADGYKAGDFYFLSFRGAEGISKEAHPFSVVSAPKYLSGYVTFMVHRLGDFTRQINKIPQGTKVKLEGPFGKFNGEIADSTGPIILYGLGSGIAPLLSISTQYAGKKKLHVIWSGQQVATDYYQALLKDLGKQGVQINTQVHRFDNKELLKIVSQDEIANGKVIIVGSPAKVLQVRKLLKQLGFSHQQLFDERMTL